MLRFGSLEDYSRRFKTYREISDIVNINVVTICSLVRRYRMNNYSFDYPSQ
jgi:hypothetical protein